MIIGFLGRLKEIIHVKYLAQYLAQSKPSVNVSYSYYHLYNHPVIVKVDKVHIIYTLKRKLGGRKIMLVAKDDRASKGNGLQAFPLKSCAHPYRTLPLMVGMEGKSYQQEEKYKHGRQLREE